MHKEILTKILMGIETTGLIPSGHGMTPFEIQFRAAILDGFRSLGDIDPQFYEMYFSELELRREWPSDDEPDDNPPKVVALRSVA